MLCRSNAFCNCCSMSLAVEGRMSAEGGSEKEEEIVVVVVDVVDVVVGPGLMSGLLVVA